MVYRDDDQLPELKPYEYNAKDASIIGSNATNAIQTLLQILQANGTINNEESTKVWEQFESKRD